MERKKSIHVWLYTILIVGIIAAVIWGATATKNAKALEVTTENQYNRAFHELVGYVDDIDTLLSKTQLTKVPHSLQNFQAIFFDKVQRQSHVLVSFPHQRYSLTTRQNFFHKSAITPMCFRSQ